MSPSRQLQEQPSTGAAVARDAGHLASPVAPLPPTALCGRVHDAFVNDAGLFAMPIVDCEGVPVGLVNRFKFLEHLASPFGRELAINKPVSAIMERQPLVVDAATDLDELGRRLLDQEQRYVFDGFIVTRDGAYAGLGTGLDLVRALTERRHQELRRLALHDMLTGLPNRALFDETLDRALVDTAEGELLALLYIDLDRFKHVNDTFGHRFGDVVLCAVAERLRDVVRKGDLVARLSGDEFAIVLPGLTAPDDADAVADVLLRNCCAPLTVDGHEVVVSCSVGIALFPQHADSKEQLIRAADAAQYHAKELRNSRQRFTPEMQPGGPRLPTTGALRHAIESDALELHYQPIYTLPDAVVCGVEALVRWTHQGAAIAAVDIVRLAEDSGLTVALSEWVMCTAMRQVVEWDAEGYPPLRLSVNVSAMQVQEGGLVALVDRLAAATRFDLRRLDIELTERAAMRASTSAHATLYALRRRGISLTLDDFGTGYSALSRLDRLPIDALKIDKSFLEPLRTGTDGIIARAIIAIARALGIRIVGEGVETAAQMEFLTSEQCDCAQGFLLALPMPAAGVRTVLQHERACS